MNRCAIVEKEDAVLVMLIDDWNHMIECHPYSKIEQSYVGNIYTGIVKNKIKGINGFFIDYGQEKDGFLPITSGNKQLSIGQTVLIQIEKDPYEQKGAKLTTDISFSGEFCVLVSDSNAIHFSSKLPEDMRTKELKVLFESYKNNTFGFIVRTNAYEADDALIKAEIDVLIEQYNRLLQTYPYRNAKTCLHNNNRGWLKLVQNMNKSMLSSFVVSTQVPYDEINEYLAEIGLHNIITVTHDANLFIREDVPNRIKKACTRKVWLNSGASIIIDRTEAMYVIDVNSNKNTSKQNHEKNILKINLEAAKEIIYQIRLRNLSGIILADFIDMSSSEDQKRLLDFLTQQATFDPIKTVIHGITSLGIVEITRKRLEKPLIEKLGEYTQFKGFTV